MSQRWNEVPPPNLNSWTLSYLPLVSGSIRLAGRHCERSEAIQSLSAEGFWIASLRSQ
ncbi:hypothetical protein NK6_1113 [Bradyrhizobium diazoefficiens]|uniref:Uncharacterized protein n=1 Tax=Bradyrhizobium diazoefficiens TaxID=1355477 RepID=A0A0E4BKV8_9BRAD|nr:hypothetical protein NK6_1113 [Bradyrhizobium diazoefficiens]